MFKELSKAVAEFEKSATKLSTLLERFDLSQVPYCDRDLNQLPIGEKVKVAKFLVHVLRTSDLNGVSNA